MPEIPALKTFPAAALLLGLAALAACGDPQVDSLSLPAPNPAAYEFEAGVGEIHQAVRDLYKLQFQERVEHPFSPLFRSDEYLTPEMRSLFTQPGNGNDVFFYYGHSPMGLSKLYRVNGRPVPFLADFHLHLTALDDSKTRVEVFPADTQVIAGKTLLPGRHFIRANIYIPVEATTIEEYSLLLRLGDMLGQTGMPALILPPE